jgi:hypothetical protein
VLTSGDDVELLSGRIIIQILNAIKRNLVEGRESRTVGRKHGNVTDLTGFLHLMPTGPDSPVRLFRGVFVVLHAKPGRGIWSEKQNR